jgi:hypothetical protein
MLITFFPKGGDRLRDLLGEGQEVLYFPTKILKHAPHLIMGLVIGSYTPSPLCYPILTLMNFHALTYPFIDPSSPASWPGKGKGTTED